MLQRARLIQEKILGEENLDTLSTYKSLGELYQGKGNYENAIFYYKKTLKSYLEVLGENHKDVARVYRSLGMTLGDTG